MNFSELDTLGQSVNDLKKNRTQLLTELHELRQRVQLSNHETGEVPDQFPHFASVISATPHPMALKNDQNIYLAANQSFAELFGLLPEDIIGKSDFNLFPEIAPMLAAVDAKILSSGSPVFDDYIVEGNQGKQYLKIIKTPVADLKTGKNVGVLCSITDTSKVRQVETALRASENRFSSLIQHMTQGVIVYTFEENENLFIVKSMNPAAAQMNNVTPQEIIGQNVLDVLPDFKNTELFFSLQKAWKTGNPEFLPAILCGSQENSWREYRIYKLPSGEMVTISEDNTQRMFALFEMLEKEQLLRNIAENYPNSYISIIDQDLKIIFTAGLEYKKQQQNPEDFIGKTPEQIFGMDGATIRELYQKTFAGEPGTLEFSNNHHFFSLRTVPLAIENNSKPRILAVVENITERKLAEEEKSRLQTQLRRSQKLETIGTLAGGIAHDFNNILTPIMGYTDMALATLTPTNPLYEDLERILKGANRARDLVDQILTFSRQIERERAPLSLHLIIYEALKLIRPAIPATIEIRQRIDPACPKILADATQMHQVIINLCTNSFHAMEERGGELIIELRPVSVDAATAESHPNLEEKEYVRLTISDTGTGMDESLLDRIFDPFFTTKPVNKGTGLGLSVVHGIVRSHDGAIVVNSQLKKGTTVHVYFPALTSETPTSDIPAVHSIHKGTEKILLIDDEFAVAEMIKKLLERLGYDVTLCTNSVEALQLFREQAAQFHVVITDLTMPGIAGLSLAQQIHEIRAEIPIILITGYGEDVSEDILPAYGIHEIIGKPFQLARLSTAIRSVLRGKS